MPYRRSALSRPQFLVAFNALYNAAAAKLNAGNQAGLTGGSYFAPPPRQRASFLAGWLIGVGVVGTIVLVIAGPADASQPWAPAAWVSWLKIALAMLLPLVAVLCVIIAAKLTGDAILAPTH